MILAIDPGPKESAFLVLAGEGRGAYFEEFGKLSNARLLGILRSGVFPADVVIEMIASYGMAVGETVFETCLFIGQLVEASRTRTYLVRRKEVVLHLCLSPRAKDSNVRAALIDRYGGPGTSKRPGLTYGIAKDTWSALAIATTFADLSKNEEWKNEHRRK